MGKANQTTIIAPEGLAVIPYSDSSTDKSESESSREFVQVPVDLDSFYLGDCEAELTETELDPENIHSDFENNLHLWKCIRFVTIHSLYRPRLLIPLYLIWCILMNKVLLIILFYNSIIL